MLREREVDKLDQYEKIFTENAVELVHSEGIEVKSSGSGRGVKMLTNYLASRSSVSPRLRKAKAA